MSVLTTWRDETILGVDWATLFASAGVSALVSAAIALVLTRRTTVLQARAERAEQAALAVDRVVQPMRLELLQYQADIRGASQRKLSSANLDDHRRATEIIGAASGLGWFRKLLVERRCRRIFGRYWTDLAILSPYDGSSFGSVVAPYLSSSFKAMDSGTSPDVTGHLFHRAFCEPPGHRLQAKLSRQLWLLAHAL